MNHKRIEIYTDGSCHTRKKIGAWAALILLENKQEILTGIEEDTTHNRMELLSVIKAIEFIGENRPQAPLRIVTDSQYVCDLPERLPRLTQNAFLTKKGTKIQNADLVKAFLCLTENRDIEWKKVRAHQRDTSEQAAHNRFVDKLSRKLVRERIVQMKFRSNLQNG